jgi:hypothetical protein
VKIIPCKQGTIEWWEARRGIPTASNFHKLLTAKTLKPSAQADDYICELIADICRLAPPDEAELYTSRAMYNGMLVEPQARRWYELMRDCDVTEVGFCVSECGRFGCSPDGLCGEQGGLELKCPTLKTHIGYLLAGGGLPDDYRAQVHGSLIISGREWWDFVSYAPGLQPILVRVEPDDYTIKLRAAMEAFYPRFQDSLRLIQS